MTDSIDPGAFRQKLAFTGTNVSVPVNSVFISYASEDRGWVRGLAEALRGLEEQDAWVDWARIPETAEWWPEILRAIDECVAFVFIITASSAESPTCRDELRHAVNRGKRILPVRLSPVDAGMLPPEITAIQWIASEANAQEVALRIHSAYHADLKWLRAQARLTVRASDWEAS